ISDEKVKQRLLEALKACHKAKDLSSQLLTFSKGKSLENKEPTNLEKLIKDTAGFTMSGSNVDFQFVVNDKVWAVEVDEAQISQVMSNMIINAAQAMTNEGKITITIENVDAKNEKGIPLTEGYYVKTTIADQGIGIPREYTSRIFDPYFTTKQSGSGLGLATSYSIIKNHGGYIT